MNNIAKTGLVLSLAALSTLAFYGVGCNAHDAKVDTTKSHDMSPDTPTTRKLRVQIIVGSTREGRMSDKIAAEIKKMADAQGSVITEIIDLKDVDLPFFNDAIAPAMRKGEIKDPIIKRWSDVINEADAFIIAFPEYNSGYPAVLKNFLDYFYPEWNHKPVALVAYSGGPSGGANALESLRKVVLALQMIPVDKSIMIPSSWKAFDTRGKLADQNLESEVHTIINQIIQADAEFKSKK